MGESLSTKKMTADLPFRHDAPIHKQCGHGKLWTEFCRGCRIVWLQDGLEDRERQLARDKAELEMLLKERT